MWASLFPVHQALLSLHRIADAVAVGASQKAVVSQFLVDGVFIHVLGVLLAKWRRSSASLAVTPRNDQKL